MPELPEVEVTKRGIEPLLLNRIITSVNVYNNRLRFVIPDEIHNLEGARIIGITRRAKYIIVETDKGGFFVIHLGMTGHLKVIPENTPLEKHDHYEMFLDNGTVFRYNDPRRFGALLWTRCEPYSLPVIKNLGIEPLTDGFNAQYLYEMLQNRKSNIKQTLMNNEVVVGIGNIYASEILYKCKISPLRKCNEITLEECQNLVNEIKITLETSIRCGGTTIRDFAQVDGKPGYFAQDLEVYGQNGIPCRICGTEISQIKQGQRTTYYCPLCQKI